MRKHTQLINTCKRNTERKQQEFPFNSLPQQYAQKNENETENKRRNRCERGDYDTNYGLEHKLKN